MRTQDGFVSVQSGVWTSESGNFVVMKGEGGTPSMDPENSFMLIGEVETLNAAIQYVLSQENP